MQQQLRFTKDQAKRLHRVTRANGVSIQAFAQAAVMAAVADAEAELRAGDPRRGRGRDDDLDAGSEPAGLGIAERLHEDRPAAAREAAPAREAPSVVVVSSGSPSSPAGAAAAVASLAAYVKAGAGYDRGRRLALAVDVLRAGTKDEAEAKVLAAELDRAVDGKGGGVETSVFDRLKDLLT